MEGSWENRGLVVFFFWGGGVTCLTFVHVGDSNLDKMYMCCCVFCLSKRTCTRILFKGRVCPHEMLKCM